ncbi:MAG: hypothetical protein CMF61_04500 [Magnetococcales bacterium]|nr:hypothetical protein [Magnetococcales bacterium]
MSQPSGLSLHPIQAVILTVCFFLILWGVFSPDDSAPQPSPQTEAQVETAPAVNQNNLAKFAELRVRATKLSEMHREQYGEPFIKGNLFAVSVQTEQEAAGAIGPLVYVIKQMEEKLGIDPTVSLDDVPLRVETPARTVPTNGNTIAMDPQSAIIANGILRDKVKALEEQLQTAKQTGENVESLQTQLQETKSALEESNTALANANARIAKLEQTLKTVLEGLAQSQNQLQQP